MLYVAELSANHNKSLKNAHDIIDAIAEAGATALKLQTYSPDTMTLNLHASDFIVPKSNKLWGGRSLYDLYDEAMTPWQWHEELFEHARELGLVAFSTPFDPSSVAFLEDLNCPIYKIASFELVDLDLIRICAATGKPLIISTGMGSLEEIARAVDAARNAGCDDLTLLKTTSSYPASPTTSNLKTMSALKEIFECKIGISDHTLGIGASVAAVTLGATVVEKHVTLVRNSSGVDASFSLEPAEFAALVYESEIARQAVGQVFFGPNAEDEDSLRFRRSYYLSTDVVKGERLNKTNARAVRPGFGLPIFQFASFEGMRFTADYRAGSPVSPEMFR